MHNYFMHPSSLRNREKLIAMRIEERAAGYGVLIMILELLRDAPNYTLKDNPKNIAFTINELDWELVDRVIHNYDLFQFDENGNFSSSWLKEALDSYTKSAEKRIERARKAANARHHKDDEEHEEEDLSNAQAMPKQCLSYAKAMPKQCLSNANAMQEQCTSNANAMLSDATFYINKSTNKSINKSINKIKKISEFEDKFALGEEELTSIYKNGEHEMTNEYLEALSKTSTKEQNTNLLAEIAQYYNLSIEDCKCLAYVVDNCRVGAGKTMQLIKTYNKNKKENFKPDLGIIYLLTVLRA